MLQLRSFNSFNSFDPNEPRWRSCCCHVTTVALGIGWFQIALIITESIYALIYGFGRSGMVASMLLSNGIVAALVAMMIIGIRRESPILMIPYLVVQVLGIIGSFASVIVLSVIVAQIPYHGSVHHANTTTEASVDVTTAAADLLTTMATDWSNIDWIQNKELFFGVAIASAIVSLAVQAWFLSICMRAYQYIRAKVRHIQECTQRPLMPEYGTGVPPAYETTLVMPPAYENEEKKEPSVLH